MVTVLYRRHLTLPWCFAKVLFCHDEGCEAIGQGIDAGTLDGGGCVVGPNNVKAGVDVGNGERVEDGVA